MEKNGITTVGVTADTYWLLVELKAKTRAKTMDELIRMLINYYRKHEILGLKDDKEFKVKELVKRYCEEQKRKGYPDARAFTTVLLKAFKDEIDNTLAEFIRSKPYEFSCSNL